MVFGKKKIQPQEQSVSMNEAYSEDYDSDLINQSFGNSSQPFVQNTPQQIKQPMQMPQQMQQVQMQRPQVNLPPIQQAMQIQQTQPINQAMIVGVEMSTEGEFIYKVVTNYLLNLGHCQLVN